MRRKLAESLPEGHILASAVYFDSWGLIVGYRAQSILNITNDGTILINPAEMFPRVGGGANQATDPRWNV